MTRLCSATRGPQPVPGSARTTFHVPARGSPRPPPRPTRSGGRGAGRAGRGCPDSTSDRGAQPARRGLARPAARLTQLLGLAHRGCNRCRSPSDGSAAGGPAISAITSEVSATVWRSVRSPEVDGEERLVLRLQRVQRPADGELVEDDVVVGRGTAARSSDRLLGGGGVEPATAGRRNRRAPPSGAASRRACGS